MSESATAFLPFLIIGISITGVGLFHVWKQFSTRKWQYTYGELLKTDIVYSPRIVDGQEVDAYLPTVRYAYEVNGTSYEGYKLRYGGTGHHTHRQQAEYVLERFNKIDKLKVYFDPENPEESVLIRDAVSRGAIGYLVIGGLLIMMSIWLMRVA